MDKSVIKEIIDEMIQKAGLDQSFAVDFYNSIIEDEDVLNEFITYLSEGKFTMANNVRGYSIVDILIWQLDHFRAYMDRGLYGMRNNECEMILKAFDTFMKMKKEPDKYVEMLTEETGTDHIGEVRI